MSPESVPGPILGPIFWDKIQTKPGLESGTQDMNVDQSEETVKVTVEKQEGNKIHLEIEVEGQPLQEAYNSALNYYGRGLKLKGFRKGKVPQHLIEQNLDTDQIKRDIFQRAMGDSYQQALADQQIESIAEPEVQAVQAEVGKDFIYKAVVEVRPDVVLGQYKGLTVAIAEEDSLSDEKIDEQIQHLRREHAILLPVDSRPAQLGDLMTLHVEASIEGESVDLGESKDMTLELREDSFVKGFSDHVVGLNVDEQKSFDLTFPEDYYVEDLRGKQIHFEIHVHEIKEVELPEVDDDFASTVHSELENLEQLQERIRKELSEAIEEQNEVQKQQKVLDKVVSNAQVAIPESMLNRELYAMWQMSEGAQLANAKVGEQTMRASLIHWMQRDELKETAGQRIKTTLVLGAVAREEGLSISQEEVDAEIQELADTHEIPVEQVKAQLEQENRMVALMDELLSFKIIDWVMENNDVVVSPELAAEQAAQVAAAAPEAAPEASAEESEEAPVEQSV
jgi:trigger factor